MKVELADIKAQHRAIDTEIKAALNEVFESCRFILGPNVSALEEEIGLLCGAEFAIGVNSGTDALLIALAALDIGPGDEVITPPFTFVATAETVCQLGAKPIFVDIDPATFCMDPELIEAAITPRTKVIMPVHLFGQISDMDAINAIAKKHGLGVVGDGAQAIGAAQNNRKVAATADITTLSFYPTKNLGACGDGGMVLTRDANFAEQSKLLRFHGSGGGYIYKRIGYCSRLDEIQAAILRIKLQRLPQWNATRKANAVRYIDRLKDLESIILPVTAPGNDHVYHQFTIRVRGGSERRDALKAHLASRDIGSAIFYPLSLHLQGPYQHFGARPGDLPVSEAITGEVLSIPIHPDLMPDQVDYVAEAIAEFK